MWKSHARALGSSLRGKELVQLKRRANVESMITDGNLCSMLSGGALKSWKNWKMKTAKCSVERLLFISEFKWSSEVLFLMVRFIRNNLVLTKEPWCRNGVCFADHEFSLRSGDFNHPGAAWLSRSKWLFIGSHCRFRPHLRGAIGIFPELTGMEVE